VAALAGDGGRLLWATLCLAAGLWAPARVGGAGRLVTVITVGMGWFALRATAARGVARDGALATVDPNA
jgi:hypothetical protein